MRRWLGARLGRLARRLEGEQPLSAHAALLESEQRLRLAVASAPLVLYARDLDLRLSWVYRPDTRRDLSVNVGRSVSQLVADPAEAERLAQLYREVIRSGEPRQLLLHIGYSPLLDAPWQNVHVRPWHDDRGGIVGVICAAYDVTELVEARAALAEREALLDLSLDMAEMGAWTYGARDRQVRHSVGLARIFGLPQAVETPLERITERLHPDDAARVQEAQRQALVSAGQLSDEFRVRRPDGAERWVAVRGRALREEDGRPRLVGVALDVTEDRQLRERLETSNRSLERFASTVAHDLRSPLQAMLGFSTVLARSLEGSLKPEQQEMLDYMLQSGRQMEGLIQGILEHSRAVHSTRVHQPVELETALEQALGRLRLEVEATGAEVSHDPLPVLHGNPVLLVQVLQNLVGNALKYRDRSRPLKIHIDARREGEEWVLAVRDNGIGIVPEAQGRLFEAFQRGGDHAEDSGLGLGLALVRDAVEYHHGRVELESTPGLGSTFYVHLPGG